MPKTQKKWGAKKSWFIAISMALAVWILVVHIDTIGIFFADITTPEQSAQESSAETKNKQLEKTCDNPDYTISAEDTKNGDNGYARVQEQYHQYINCLFNNAVELLEEEEEKFAQQQSSSEQEGSQAQSIEGCMDPNVYKAILNNTKTIDIDTTGETREFYGLADLIIDEYLQYNLYLDTLSDTLIQSDDNQIRTVDYAQRQLTARFNEIERERYSAQKAFDIALQAYDEMRVAYPLHKQLECIASNLEEERDQIARIRTYAQCFPAKFINAATSDYNR